MNLRTMSDSQLNKEKVVIHNDVNSTINHHDSSVDIQLIHSPSRSIRRDHSNVSDDDQFQMVTYKKSKQLLNQRNNNNNHHQVYIHQDNNTENDNVNMVTNVNDNNGPNSS